MTHEQFTRLAAAVASGEISAAERARFDAHAATCAECRSLTADFSSIRAAARQLDQLTPPPRLRERLARHLAAADARDQQATPPGWRFAPIAWPAWLGAAAALILATGVGLWSLDLSWRSSEPSALTTASAPAELAASVEAELSAAEAHYEKAIAGLEQIARSESGELDPQVASVLQNSLLVIDQAINESRAAIREQPSSLHAQESLFGALRDKVVLLQQTVELINEMRKGNQTEAGRIIQGLNQP